MKVKELRFMDKRKVRDVCIEHDWYNRGSNEEYAAMFDLWDAPENVTVKKLEKVVRDIMAHSSEEVMGGWNVVGVMSELANKCCTVWFMEN